MQLDEFEFEMQKLANFCGRKLSDQQLDIWFQKLGHLNRQALHSAIDRITDRKNTFPTPEEVRETAKEFKGIYEPIKAVGCDDCRSSGWIHAERFEYVGQPYAFRCHCKNGDNFSKNISVWSSDWERGFRKL